MDIFWANFSGHFLMVITNSANMNTALRQGKVRLGRAKIFFFYGYDSFPGIFFY